MTNKFRIGDRVTVGPGHSTECKVIAIQGDFAWVGLEPGVMRGTVQLLEELRKIERPFAVGDRAIHPMAGEGTIAAFTPDGEAVFLYQAGDKYGAVVRDPSCLERV